VLVFFFRWGEFCVYHVILDIRFHRYLHINELLLVFSLLFWGFGLLEQVAMCINRLLWTAWGVFVQNDTQFAKYFVHFLFEILLSLIEWIEHRCRACWIINRWTCVYAFSSAQNQAGCLFLGRLVSWWHTWHRPLLLWFDNTLFIWHILDLNLFTFSLRNNLLSILLLFAFAHFNYCLHH
jgi:hypothetical protein